MKKTKLLLLLAMACSFISCDKDNSRVGIIVALSPCHVESIMAFANIDSTNTSGYRNVPGNVEKELIISVFTYDSIIGWTGDESEFYFNFESTGAYCKESIPEVEQYINNLAKGGYENAEPIGYQATTRLSCYYYPYRLEGVTAFTITANHPFNGIEAGKDITQCFSIKEFIPDLIFSYDNYSAYSSTSNKNVTITEWLALRPLATPCMHLHLHEDIQLMVDNITFTITMTLTNGKVLTATTPAVSIVK